MCIRCDAGSEPNAEQTECQVCVGTYSADGSACLACPAGSQPTVGYEASGCTTCASQGPNLFSVDGSECVECSAGSEVDDSRSSCTLCAYGLHSTDGSTCESCPAGSHPHDPAGGQLPPVDGGADGCDSCVLIGEATISSDGLQCVACPNAQEPNDDRVACVDCADVSAAHYRGPTSGGRCESGREAAIASPPA